MRMALLGYGRFGRVHARRASAQGDFELACVVDSDPVARGAALADGFHAVASLHELPKGIQAATVVTPPETHAAVAIELMRRGIHVLVEKPLASTCSDLQAMLDAQRDSHCQLCTAHIERFNSHVVCAAGVLRHASALRFSRHSTRPSAGPLDMVLDLMVHDLDLAAHVLGVSNEASFHVQGLQQRRHSVHAHGVLDGRRIELAVGFVRQSSQASLAAWVDDRPLHLKLSAAPLGETDALTRQYAAWFQQLQGQPSAIASGADGAAAVRRALAVAQHLQQAQRWLVEDADQAISATWG